MKYQRADGTFAEYPHSFHRDELDDLARRLDEATLVVPLREAIGIGVLPGMVAMRHDVDHNLEHALRFAEWEASHGWGSTYFVLPCAWYWQEPDVPHLLERIAALGHEIGLHVNAIVEACAMFPARQRWETPATRLSGDCVDLIRRLMLTQLSQLRRWGHEIVGVAAHGDIRSYEFGVYNDFRYTGLRLEDFDLEYDADTLAKTGRSISDNHGTIVGGLDLDSDGTTFFLSHPCHWAIGEVESLAASR